MEQSTKVGFYTGLITFFITGGFVYLWKFYKCRKILKDLHNEAKNNMRLVQEATEAIVQCEQGIPKVPKKSYNFVSPDTRLHRQLRELLIFHPTIPLGRRQLFNSRELLLQELTRYEDLVNKFTGSSGDDAVAYWLQIVKWWLSFYYHTRVLLEWENNSQEATELSQEQFYATLAAWWEVDINLHTVASRLYKRYKVE